MVFTVFTPAYNRAHTLARVYESLCKQTLTDFEWLIVDDGSTDGTQELVCRWQRDGCITIRYAYKPNGGKHTAINLGVREARGELFLTLDSDDACVPTALERLRYYWLSIPESERHRFSAVTAQCITPAGHIVGSSLPISPLDSNSIELRSSYGVIGERWGFQRTAVMREFPFPEFEGEKFISESIVWNRIARKYLTRYVDEPLRIYYDNEQDGLSASSIRSRAKSPRGACLVYREQAMTSLSLSSRCRDVINYLRFALHGGDSFPVAFVHTGFPGLACALFPVACLLWLRDRRGI